MGRKRRQGKFTLQKTNNSVEDLVGNEENGYPVPHPNKAMIMSLRSPVTPPPHTQKKNLQRRNLERNL
jgi:hypothetical protein